MALHNIFFLQNVPTNVLPKVSLENAVGREIQTEGRQSELQLHWRSLVHQRQDFFVISVAQKSFVGPLDIQIAVVAAAVIFGAQSSTC